MLENYKTYFDRVVLVKDYRPSYPTIELIKAESFDALSKQFHGSNLVPCSYSYLSVMSQYGECRLLSSSDDAASKTNTIVILVKPL
jgi:hypothetical protein